MVGGGGGGVGQEVEPRLQHLQPCDLTPSWQPRYQQRRLQMLPGLPFSSNMAGRFFNPHSGISYMFVFVYVFVCVCAEQEVLGANPDQGLRLCDKRCQGAFRSGGCSVLVVREEQQRWCVVGAFLFCFILCVGPLIASVLSSCVFHVLSLASISCLVRLFVASFQRRHCSRSSLRVWEPCVGLTR